jgi:eukaryotic-like serine/threonine-protein kinase
MKSACLAVSRSDDRAERRQALPRGTRLGRYEIRSLLGSGGMGEVYRARDTALDRDVAVKILPEAFAADPQRLARFESEARAASALSDPHVVTVFDAGRQGGIPYFVSELVEGETLRVVLDSQKLSLRKLVDLSVQIASGLAAAHAQGIVHRDLKPDNVLISRSGIAKIADFGLAKLREAAGPHALVASTAPTAQSASTAEGVILGTVGYMAPEQVRGEHADTRADIFAFGCILYEMATGRRAFDGYSPIEKMASILRDDPPAIRGLDPSLPAELDRIVTHCLEKDSEQRFQSARDLAFALQVSNTACDRVANRRTERWHPARFAIALGLGLAGLLRMLLPLP